MACSECGGTRYRCVHCGHVFDDPDVRVQIIAVLMYRRALPGSQIAARTGIPRSTVYRHLAAMVHEGEAIKEPGRKGYRKPTPQEQRLAA